MKNKWEALFPVGLDWRQELRWTGAGLLLSLLYSGGFLFRFKDAYNQLFFNGRGRVPIPGAVMADFGELLGNAFLGFAALGILCLVGIPVYHYFHHYIGSKSIYLMRRLPRRSELWRRCGAFPLLSGGVSLAAAALLLALYFGIYLWVTPESCLAPGQWQRLWSVYVGV